MKPLPKVLPLERPYWEHAKAHRLALQRCARCSQFRFPASPVCPECNSEQSEWTPTSGRGELVSWVIFHKSYFRSFDSDLPYNVALIRLDEGPVICANVVGVDNQTLTMGMRLKACFDDINEEFSILRFQPE